MLYRLCFSLFLLVTLFPLRVCGTETPGSRTAWVLETPEGAVLSSMNPGESMPPASILKVLTALYALESLGPDYRIATPWHRDAEGRLVLTARSDPLLTSVPLKTLVEKLTDEIRERHFPGLVIDVSGFEKKMPLDGRSDQSLRSYNAPLTPFAVNFNSVSFKTEKGKLVSGEEETPLLPMALEAIQASGLRTGRIALPEEGDFPIRYAAALARHFLQEAGFSFDSEAILFRDSPPPQPDTLLLEVPSEFTIAEIVQRLLAYSNNLIANQLLLFTASHNLKTENPIRLEDARQDLARFMKERLQIQDFSIEEGSGLSRKNRISCQEMMKALRAFLPYMELMRKEPMGRYKTGTLSDVRTRAGYLRGDTGWHPYVLMIHGDNDAYPGRLEALKRRVRASENRSAKASAASGGGTGSSPQKP